MRVSAACTTTPAERFSKSVRYFRSLATSSASTCRSLSRQSKPVPVAARPTTRSVKPAVSQPRRRIGSRTSLLSTLAMTYQWVAGTGAIAAITGTWR